MYKKRIQEIIIAIMTVVAITALLVLVNDLKTETNNIINVDDHVNKRNINER